MLIMDDNGWLVIDLLRFIDTMVDKCSDYDVDNAWLVIDLLTPVDCSWVYIIIGTFIGWLMADIG